MMLEKPEAPSFNDVARTIADAEPPGWLPAGLEHFSEGIGAIARNPGGEQQIIERMHEAVAVLLKYLPAFDHLPFGLEPPEDVTEAMQALPGVMRELKRTQAQPHSGRKPLIAREICAAVVIEAWRLYHHVPSLSPLDAQVIPAVGGRIETKYLPDRIFARALSVLFAKPLPRPERKAAELPAEEERPAKPLPGPRSIVFQQACNDYWRACGCEEIGAIGDIENWRRPLERALDEDHAWIRAMLLAVQNAD